MVELFKKELTDKKVSYYYREDDDKVGIITFYFDTDEWVVEKYCDELEKRNPYLTHKAKCRMKEYIEKNNYPDEDYVMWY